jgi:hypothetical protein
MSREKFEPNWRRVRPELRDGVGGGGEYRQRGWCATYLVVSGIDGTGVRAGTLQTVAAWQRTGTEGSGVT